MASLKKLNIPLDIDYIISNRHSLDFLLIDKNDLIKIYKLFPKAKTSPIPLACRILQDFSIVNYYVTKNQMLPIPQDFINLFPISIEICKLFQKDKSEVIRYYFYDWFNFDSNLLIEGLEDKSAKVRLICLNHLIETNNNQWLDENIDKYLKDRSSKVRFLARQYINKCLE